MHHGNVNPTNRQEDNLDQDIEKLVKDLEPLIQQMKIINDHAVIAYTPLVDDLCNRNAGLSADVCWRRQDAGIV